MDAILPARPDVNRILEQQVEAGFPPELAFDLALNELVVRAVDATGASSAALALLRGDQMVCRAATGLRAPDLGVPLDTHDGLSGTCLRTRQPQLCADTESDPRVDAAIARDLGIRSMLIVPVLDDEDEDLMGVLEVFSSEPSAFSEQEQALLEASARDCARVRRVAADLGKRPPAAFTFVPSDQPPAPVETPQFSSPTFVETPASFRKTQPLYEHSTLILGTLAVLAAVALSFMVGFRTGWLFSEPPAPQVQFSQSPSSEAATLATLPAAPAAPFPSSSLVPASTSTPQSVRPATADELVVYDHGKVIFRLRPVVRKIVAGPVVDGSETNLAPSQGVWLAPDQAERRLRNRIEPQYPADASAAHRSGDVVLEVLVAEDGSVASISTLSGDPVLAAAATQAVRHWRYEPYRLQEHPSPFQTDVTLKFTLPN
ncbi:MAG: TonB family protein [Acidobacteriia bacterium]|nr:TonB family protein [Terriglobia bacterium]